MARNSTSPTFHGSSFQCPHSECGVEAQQTWGVLYANDEETGDAFDPNIEVSTCNGCRDFALWERVREDSGFSGNMVYPVIEFSGPLPNADLPDPVKALYDEARSVVMLSPRSASALLRLSLEALLEHIYPEAHRLNDRIGLAAKDGVPDLVTKAIDVLRSKGNDSVHKIEAEDTAQTAESLFRIVNLVVERLITEPREVAEMHETLPPGVLDQIRQRDSDAG